jgi:hypothetical protein
MPVRIQCASCQAGINAPDHLVGKKVKCPKCSAPVLVVAGMTPAPAAPPGPRAAPATAPARPRSAPSQPALPLLSFEELKVPPRMQRKIEKEVGEEQIVWMGRQDPGARLKQARLGPPIGLILLLIGLAAGGYIGHLAFSGDPGKKTLTLLIAGGVGGVFVLMGLPLLFMPQLVRYFMNYRDCYILTERRTLVIGFVSRKSFDAEALKDRKVKVRADGLGDIVMGYEEFETGGTFAGIRSKTYSGPSGKKVVSTIHRTATQTHLLPVGFIDVSQVEEVEKLIQQTLGLPPTR